MSNILTILSVPESDFSIQLHSKSCPFWKEIIINVAIYSSLCPENKLRIRWTCNAKSVSDRTYLCGVSRCMVMEFIFKVMNRDEVGWFCLVLMMFTNKDGRKYATVTTSSVTNSEAHECKIFLKFRRKSKNQICFPL